MYPNSTDAAGVLGCVLSCSRTYVFCVNRLGKINPISPLCLKDEQYCSIQVNVSKVQQETIVICLQRSVLGGYTPKRHSCHCPRNLRPRNPSSILSTMQIPPKCDDTIKSWNHWEECLLWVCGVGRSPLLQRTKANREWCLCILFLAPRRGPPAWTESDWCWSISSVLVSTKDLYSDISWDYQ